MEENCDYNFPIGLCITGNVCGYISNCIWFLVLLPQLYKNYKKKHRRFKFNMGILQFYC